MERCGTFIFFTALSCFFRSFSSNTPSPSLPATIQIQACRKKTKTQISDLPESAFPNNYRKWRRSAALVFAQTHAGPTGADRLEQPVTDKRNYP